MLCEISIFIHFEYADNWHRVIEHLTQNRSYQTSKGPLSIDHESQNDLYVPYPYQLKRM